MSNRLCIIRHRQSGIALATSLILLMAMSVVGITAATLADNRERSAANYRQQVDAMMAAEFGARVVTRDTLTWIRDTQRWPSAAESAALFDATWQRLGPQVEGFPDAQRFRVVGDPAWTDDLLVFEVEGAIRQADNTLSTRSTQVHIARVTGASEAVQPFEDGVVGCEGVNQVGSASIDSFHSGRGAYGATLADGALNRQTGEVRVRTISDGANGTFSGNAPVYGDVAITGNLTMNGATPIYGNLFVDGNGGTMNGTVTGSASFGGSVNFGTASNVQGPVLAGGNVTVQATSTPPPSISAGGSVSFPSWWVWNALLSALTDLYQGNQNNLDIPPVFNPGQECDPLQIINPNNNAPGPMFNDVWNNPATRNLADYFTDSGCPQCFSENNNAFSLTGGDGNAPAEHTVIGADGQSTMLRVDNSLTTQGRLQSLTIRGDVTLVVDGDFDIGGASQLNIAPDANLSLLVTGQSTLGAGSNVLTSASGQHQPFVRNGKPAFSLYSSHVSGNQHPGVTVSGSNNSAVSIYAPGTAVRVTGSGSIFGAVRGGFLDLRGSGNIHYDTMLGEFDAPGTGGVAAVDGRLGGWWEGVQ